MQQNIRTTANQLRFAEDALGEFLSDETDASMNAGPLPLSEIIEELDDDDNVICTYNANEKLRGYY